MLAIRMMLPPFPNRSICWPAAWAVKSAPFTFTSKTCGDGRTDNFSSARRRDTQHELASWNVFAEYVKHGSVGGKMPAPATHASILPSRSPIVFPIFHIPS